ncbi:MAG: hypothetical protein K0S11_1720 [Gammaproteobacteria bacterium]|jgi:hypothetical protein|nr:hypothetical protein [Gammaproteobacteria bacterium]
MLKKPEQLNEARRVFVSARAKYAGTAKVLSINEIGKILEQLQHSIELAQNTEKTMLEAKKLYLDIIQENQAALLEVGNKHYLTNQELVTGYASLLELRAYQKIPRITENCIKGTIKQLELALNTDAVNPHDLRSAKNMVNFKIGGHSHAPN